MVKLHSNGWFQQWFVLLLVLTPLVCAHNNLFTANLEAGIASPFELVLLESIAAVNESYYVPTLLKLFGIDDEDFDIEELDLDQQVFHAILNHLPLNLFEKTSIEFDVTNKIHTPRIQTHYDHYQTVSSQYDLAELKDSFGNSIARDGAVDCWVLFNDQIYGSIDDLYALKTDSRLNFVPSDYDRVVGTEGPLVVLYGNPKAEEFKLFLLNLYESANIGKLRFVWRYVPSTKLPESLSGYGVDLTIKRSDYLTIDDRDISSKSTKKKTSSSKKLRIAKDLAQIDEIEDIIPVSESSLSDLGLKFSSLVLSTEFEGYSSYEILEKLLNDFPKYASFIADSTPDYDKVKDIVKNNENIGLSKDSYGIYINGSPIHKLELDFLKLFDKIKHEANIIFGLQLFGFTSQQAKFLIKKFATLSAYKQVQFRSGNSIMGKNENRFRIYEYSFSENKTNGVVFLNDIEKDDSYSQLTTDAKQAYLETNIQPNQIPPLRENIHDIIFALKLTDVSQLRVLFTLSKIVLDNGIPQQIGIIPIATDENDKLFAKIFYFLVEKTSPQEALAFLYKYMEAESEDEVQDLIDKIDLSDYEFDDRIYQDVLNKFALSQASVIFNGVIFDLAAPNWQISMGKQISQDVNLLKHHLRSENANEIALKDILYDNAKHERNLRIIPADLQDAIYKPIDQELIDNSILFKKTNGIVTTFWLIGDFNKDHMRAQLVELLKTMKDTDIQIRIVNSGEENSQMKSIKKLVFAKNLSNSNIDKIIDFLNQPVTTTNVDEKTIALLERKHLPVHHGFILYNSRYVRVDRPLANVDILSLIEYENNHRLSIINDILNAYPDVFGYKSIHDVTGNNAYSYDLLTSLITKSFHVDDKLFITDVSRFDFGTVDMSNSINITNGDVVDVLLIIDPIDEHSQKLVSMVNSIKNIPYLNIKIVLQPKLQLDEVPIKRFYRGVFPSSAFNENGKWLSVSNASFKNLPSQEILTTELDVPNNWITVAKQTPVGVDLDNIKFDNYDDKSILATYELKYLLIEGYAKDVKLGSAPVGVSISLQNGNFTTDTSIMSTMGYLQLHTKPGISQIKLQGNSSENYNLLSANDNKFAANNIPLDSLSLGVYNLHGKRVYPRLQKNKNKEKLSQDVRDGTDDQAEINIFSVASGHLYERFLSIMMASVRKHSQKSIKFWIIENFISPHFKQLLPKLAEKYKFDYEFVSYKWPNFLRSQREKQRTIWGYKILFLDVLFPQTLKKVIFVDADQIARADMSELTKIDLEGAPYGFVPMGDDREDMEGYRFWKSGYWQQMLGDEYKYHISALFVVDLIKFRSIQAGERLRSHYQKLSSDSSSLSNLDQDLPNNLQRQIKIFSLPEDWLWCDTWCDSSRKSRAKTIDLCNDPLTKESKLERARRIIPEWQAYDDEINKLRQEAEQEIIQIQAESDIENHDFDKEFDEDEFDDFDHDEL